MQKLKIQAANAVRHGAAWFTVAGVSGVVLVWAGIEIVKKVLAN